MDISHDPPNFIHTHFRCKQWNSVWYIHCVWNPFVLARSQDGTGANTEKVHSEHTSSAFARLLYVKMPEESTRPAPHSPSQTISTRPEEESSSNR